MKTIKFFLAFTLLLFAVTFMAACNEGAEIKETEKNEPVKEKIEETTAEETTAEETTIPESTTKEEPYLPEDALITPDADLQEEIASAFGFKKEIVWFEIDCETNEIFDGSIRCYGVFDDCVAIFLEGSLIKHTTKEIAGYEFYFGHSFSLYAYCDGNLYELEEAYDKGLVSKETIKKAADNHRAVEEYIHYLRSLEKN